MPRIRLMAFRKSGENLREDRFSFAHNRCIRQAGFEKKGVLKGHFRAAHNHLHADESLPDPSQEVKGALDVPQIESAADNVGLPVENPFEKMPVVEFLFVRRQPPTLVVGGKTGALRSVEQIAGGHGQIFSCCRVVLDARQLEEEKLLLRPSFWHKISYYHSSRGRTNADHGLLGLQIHRDITANTVENNQGKRRGLRAYGPRQERREKGLS